MNKTGNTFSKRERLKSRKLIEEVFAKGKSIKGYPVIFVFQQHQLSEEVPFQVGFSVSKKRFKRAVDRNKIKRLMVESWRTSNKELLNSISDSGMQFAGMWLYVGTEIPNHQLIDDKIRYVVSRFQKELHTLRS